MRTAMTYLEKGSFVESLQFVDQSLQSMCMSIWKYFHIFLPIVVEKGANTVKGEANFCVAYKVALGLLIAIREIEMKIAANPANNNEELFYRMAFLSKLLSDIPLKTNHRIVCVRMAISKNMAPQV